MWPRVWINSCYLGKPASSWVCSQTLSKRLELMQFWEQDNTKPPRDETSDNFVPDFKLDVTPCSPQSDGSCSCPRRTHPPPLPSGLTKSQLKKRIVDHYAASAFKKCTQQTLPMMRGDLLPIITDPAAIPVAAHSPIPVPLQWEERVK